MKCLVIAILWLACLASITPRCQGQVPNENASQQTADTAKIKKQIERYYQRGRAITVTLKTGAVYYHVPPYAAEVKQPVDAQRKIAGKLEQINAEDFLLGERSFIGYQYLTKRIRYDDVKKLHANLIPDGLKSTGEILFWCVLLFPTGACAM